MIDFNKVRVLAQKTLESSCDLLSIDNSLINNVLIPKLKFSKSTSTPKQIFVKDKKDEAWELGINIFFNVINFCFKDPDTRKEYKYHALSGGEIKRSTGLFTALSESEVNWGEFHEITNIGKDEWIKIIQLSKLNPLFLGEDRLLRVKNLARYLLETNNKTVFALLKNSKHQADVLADILFKSGLFEDDFLKRVQVAVHAVDNVLRRRHSKGLKNINMLTCKADYRIPQVLYNLNIIQLSSKLKKQLIKEQLIIPDSREELALRSSVIIVGALVAKGMNITEVEADLLLWNLSQDMYTKAELPIPHMLVATDKY